MDEKDLKIMALKEGFSKRLANLAADYEEEIAQLRVQLTVLHNNQQPRDDAPPLPITPDDNEVVEGD